MANHIAYSLCWDLCQTSIPYQEFKFQCHNFGIDPKHIPSQPSPINAFRNAKSNMVAWLKKDLLSWSIQPLHNNNTAIAYQLDREKQSVSGTTIESHPIAHYEFNKATEVINCFNIVGDRAIAMQVYDRLKAEYDNCLNNSDKEHIRKLLSSWCSSNAVSLRKGGGFYFVPASKKQELDQLTALIKIVSPNSSLDIRRILAEAQDLPGHIKDVSKGLNSEILTFKRTVAKQCGFGNNSEVEDSEQIHELEQELDKFLANASLPQSMREKTISDTIKEYRELRGKVEAIAGEIGFKSSPLTEKLDSLTNLLKLGKAPAPSTPEPIPTPVPVPQKAKVQSSVAAKFAAIAIDDW